MKPNWKVATGMLLGLTIAGGTIIWLQVNPEEWGIKNSTLLFMGILIFISSLLYRKENFIGNLAGIIAPLATGYIIFVTGSYSSAFALAAIVLVSGLLAYWFIVGKLEPPATLDNYQ